MDLYGGNIIGTRENIDGMDGIGMLEVCIEVVAELEAARWDHFDMDL